MVSCGIWDVAYFSFIAKLDLCIFWICFITNLEHLKKSSMVVRHRLVNLNATDFSPNVDPSFFSNLAPGVPTHSASLTSTTCYTPHCLTDKEILIKRMRTHSHQQTRDKNQTQVWSCGPSWKAVWQRHFIFVKVKVAHRLYIPNLLCFSYHRSDDKNSP